MTKGVRRVKGGRTKHYQYNTDVVVSYFKIMMCNKTGEVRTTNQNQDFQFYSECDKYDIEEVTKKTNNFRIRDRIVSSS